MPEDPTLPTVNSPLRESAEHMRYLLELNPQVPWIADREGKVIDFNQRWLDWTGLTREQALGEGWKQVPHPDELAALSQAWMHAVQTGEAYDIEHRIRRADGSYRWARSRATARLDAHGKVLMWYGTTEDIHDHKLAELALTQSEHQFRILADAIPQLCWMAHADGHIFWYNKRWYDYTGTTPQQMEGWGWQSVHDPESLPAVVEGWQQSIATGKPFDMVFPLRGRDRRFRAFLTRVEPLRDETGKVIRWFGTNTDIDSERAIRLELERANRELEHFAYVASHDLQEPLRLVSNYLQLIERRYAEQLNPEALEFFAIVKDAARRMRRLIQDLLSFSRLGRSEAQFQRVSCNHVLTTALQNLEMAAKDQGAHVTQDDLPDVDGDEVQLTQLFQNLIGNAIKFRGVSPPRIHVSARRNGEFWILSVTDNGIGINPAYKDRIFIIFQRLNARDEFSGTGIGLAVCKKIVELHGGAIWFESEENKGSAFYFTVPVAREH